MKFFDNMDGTDKVGLTAILMFLFMFLSIIAGSLYSDNQTILCKQESLMMCLNSGEQNVDKCSAFIEKVCE